MNLKLVCKNKILIVSYQNSSLKYLAFEKPKIVKANNINFASSVLIFFNEDISKFVTNENIITYYFNFLASQNIYFSRL